MLDARALQLANDAHRGLQGEALLRVEILVDGKLAAANQLVTEARLEEAETLYQEAAKQAPASWKARYKYARFWLDNGQEQLGLQRLRALGAVLNVVEMTVAPTIDGHLDEAVWAQAAQTDLPFLSYRGYVLPADMTTRVCLGYGAEGIYLGIYSHDDRMDSLRAAKTNRDDQVWAEESAELFFDANLDRRSYVQIVANAIGTIFDAAGENGLASADVSWTPNIEVAAHQGTDFWSLEMLVHYERKWLPKPSPGDLWGANFARNFRDRAHSSQWVYTYGQYHQPDGFGVLVFK